MAKSASVQTFETPFGVYTTSKVIGEGGSGRVFAATDESQSPFAVKLLDPHKATKDKQKRFRNEIFFGKTFAHPNVVPILDYGIAKLRGVDAPFYVMPLYGDTLRGVIKAKNTADALRYFSQMLDGIEAAHLRGVWHRDLKPENIVIDIKSKTAVVADFGIARFGDDLRDTAVETKPSSRLANFAYAAPEQRTGGTVDHRADIFALGLILHELFTGVVPHGTRFTGIVETSTAHGYLDPLVARMLSHNPNERPSSIEEIKKELIKRQLDFVSLQKLDTLRNTVVPAAQVTDAITTDPIRVKGGRWEDGALHFELNRQPAPLWIQAFKNSTGGYYMNYPPETIRFFGNRATWPSDANVAQGMIGQFKERVQAANTMYLRELEQDAQRAEAARRQQLEREAAAEEQTRRLNERLQF